MSPRCLTSTPLPLAQGRRLGDWEWVEGAEEEDEPQTLFQRDDPYQVALTVAMMTIAKSKCDAITQAQQQAEEELKRKKKEEKAEWQERNLEGRLTVK